MPEPTAREELARIRGLMEESQRVLHDTWKHQIAWGVVTLIGVVATWWAVGAGRPGLAAAAWAVLLTGGWIASFVLGRAGHPGPVRSGASRALGGVWIGLGVSLTVLGTLGVWSGAFGGGSVPGIVAVVLGAGYFATAAVAGLGWLRLVAVGWWAGGVLLIVWPGPHALPALAGMVALLQLLPAVALRRRERREVGAGR